MTEAVEDERVERERTQELVVAPQPSGVTVARHREWDQGQKELIKATVAKDASNAELAMFLELCARYDLDPFAKQIWCAKMGGQGGGVTIMVSRDGLLSIASRPGAGFDGMDGDVVYSNDDFNKVHSPEGLVVRHEVKSFGADRGELLGAWAIVHREGRHPTYFAAELSQYKKPSEKTPWGKQIDAMILKCAESMALRKAFVISGVVGEDEMRLGPKIITQRGGEATPDVNWPEDEELAEGLRSAMNTLGWTLAKQRLSVNGKQEDELRELLVTLNNEADAEAEPVEGEVASD